MIKKLVDTKELKGLTSKVYKILREEKGREKAEPVTRRKWIKELGPITDQQWKMVLAQGAQVSLSPSQRMSQLYLLYRAYYTPYRMKLIHKNKKKNYIREMPKMYK